MQTTEQRIAMLEARLADYDAMVERLMMLAALNPIGRKLMKQLAGSR